MTSKGPSSASAGFAAPPNPKIPPRKDAGFSSPSELLEPAPTALAGAAFFAFAASFAASSWRSLLGGIINESRLPLADPN